MAATSHLGPYARLGDAHAALLSWCAVHRRPSAGPTWEIYGHWQPTWAADPSQIRTDVFHLLRS